MYVYIECREGGEIVAIVVLVLVVDVVDYDVC